MSEAYMCPFCAGTSFSKNTWCVGDAEVDALECNSCLAGAPLSAWEKLFPKPITVEQWNDGQIDLMEVKHA